MIQSLGGLGGASGFECATVALHAPSTWGEQQGFLEMSVGCVCACLCLWPVTCA